MTFYDIWHMTQDVINYVNMGIKRTVLIQRSDPCGLESFVGNKIWRILQKTKIPDFPLYFLANSLVKLKTIFASLNVL